MCGHVFSHCHYEHRDIPQISHRTTVMGNLWETRVVRVEIRRVNVPQRSHKVFTMGNLWESFHNGKSMGHVEHLSAGMGNLWYTLQNECPISMPQVRTVMGILVGMGCVWEPYSHSFPIKQEASNFLPIQKFGKIRLHTISTYPCYLPIPFPSMGQVGPKQSHTFALVRDTSS